MKDSLISLLLVTIFIATSALMKIEKVFGDFYIAAFSEMENPDDINIVLDKTEINDDFDKISKLYF